MEDKMEDIMTREAAEKMAAQLLIKKTTEAVYDHCSKQEKAITEFVNENCEAIYEDGELREYRIRHPEGTFIWAIEQMKQGKQVMVEDYLVWKFCKASNNFFNRRKENRDFKASSFSCTRWIESDTWKIYNENLNDKLLVCEGNEHWTGGELFYKRDVQVALSKLRSRICGDVSFDRINKAISEVFAVEKKGDGGSDGTK